MNYNNQVERVLEGLTLYQTPEEKAEALRNLWNGMQGIDVRPDLRERVKKLLPSELKPRRCCLSPWIR